MNAESRLLYDVCYDDLTLNNVINYAVSYLLLLLMKMLSIT